MLFNNGVHESTGAQPNVGNEIQWTQLAQSCGYVWTATAETAEEIQQKFMELKEVDGPAFLEVKVKQGTRSDLGRPTETTKQCKKNFMKFLEN